MIPQSRIATGGTIISRLLFIYYVVCVCVKTTSRGPVKITRGCGAEEKLRGDRDEIYYIKTRARDYYAYCAISYYIIKRVCTTRGCVNNHIYINNIIYTRIYAKLWTHMCVYCVYILYYGDLPAYLLYAYKVHTSINHPVVYTIIKYNNKTYFVYIYTWYCVCVCDLAINHLKYYNISYYDDDLNTWPPHW